MLLLKLKKHLGIISKKRFDEILSIKKIKKSGLFDAKWYLKQYQDVARARVNPIEHYLRFGWKEGRNPSPNFDNNAYLRDNPDVANAHICPLVHYIEFGRTEGRVAKNLSGAAVIMNTSFKEKIKYAFEYPVRVYNEYHELKDEIRKLKR